MGAVEHHRTLLISLKNCSVRSDEPEIAAKLRIEERELDAGGLN